MPVRATAVGAALTGNTPDDKIFRDAASAIGRQFLGAFGEGQPAFFGCRKLGHQFAVTDHAGLELGGIGGAGRIGKQLAK